MDVSKAQSSFIYILDSLNDQMKRDEFLRWVGNISKARVSDCDHHPLDADKSGRAKILLTCIQSVIKENVPFDAVMTSEQICYPTTGEDAHLHANNCVHVDAFLYDEDAVDELVNTGKLSNALCKSCGSTDTEPITFITHSMSVERLRHTFCVALPSLKGKTLVDVGSRLGAVLYGAYAYSDAKQIFGIEMNADLCNLQSHIVKRFKLENRIQILEGDMQDFKSVLADADVVVLNNVFEWFVPIQLQANCWHFLHSTIRENTIVVASPPIKKSLRHLQTGINAEEWVAELPDLSQDKQFIEENDIRCYEVKSRISK